MTASREQRETKTGSPPVQRKEEGSPEGAGALKSGLRAASFAEGEAMLAPPAPPPAGNSAAAPVQRKADAAVQRDETVASHLPDNVDLRSARISFTLPAGKRLAGMTAVYDATTQYATTVTIEASANGLRVWTSPSLLFDVTFPAANVRFGEAGVRFSSGAVYADMYKSGTGIDCSGWARDAVVDILGRAVGGSAMARPGYNPMSDGDLMGTLARIKANFDAMPESRGSGGGGGVGAGDVSRPSIGATLAMRTPFFQAAGGAGVRINAGGQFDVNIQGTGNLARILAAGNPQDAAVAAGIREVSVSSEAIELLNGGEVVAKLQSLRVAPGGHVTLQRFTLEGGLGTGAGIESLFRLLAGGIAMAERGVPLEVGMEATARSGGAEPEIVRGVSRHMIEEGLTSAVQGLLRDNRFAVPGIDLGLVFGAGG